MQRLYDALEPLVQYTRSRVTGPMTVDEVIRSRPSAKRRRFERCRYQPVNSRISAFVKYEKLPLVKLEQGKAPRMIQYRNPSFTLELLRFILPIETALYDYKYRGKRVFAKGRDLHQMAADLDRGRNAVLMDHTGFDAHVNKQLLALEHWFYVRVFGNDPALTHLLRQQRVNKGRTRCGLQYQIEATRMSGDANTSLGNTIINYAILSAVCGRELYVNGDDSVAWTDARPTKQDFAVFGMETKIEFVDRFNVEFCQTKVLQSKRLCVREPFRAVARLLCLKQIDKTYLRQVLLCEAICNNGVPVFGILHKYCQNTRLVYHDEFVGRWSHLKRHRKMGDPITSAVRADYANVFGISPAQQHVLEKRLTECLDKILGC